MGITPGLATGIGAAGNITYTSGYLVGLATASGTAGNVAQPVAAGLASATGAALAPTAPRAVGLAIGAGAAFAPAIGIAPGVAQGVGAAGNATNQIIRTPQNLGGSATPVFIDGAAITYASTLGGTLTVPDFADGTLTVLTYDGSITLANYGGSAVTVASTYGGTLTPPNYGGGVTPVTIDGSITLANYGGTAASVANTYGGTLTLPNYGGGVTPVTVDASITLSNYGGSCSSQANTYGGTLTLTDYEAALVGWTMQQVSLTLAENNDESVNIAITQNGSALSLSGATINMYFKTAAGTPDGSALLLSTAGGSPAITITNSSGGLATAAIPHNDLSSETYNFYRIDVVFGGLQNTCIYGPITWITL
jgi:hypothetical protein